MNIQEAISRLANSEHLSTEEMISVMRQIMSGEATPAQIGGFLVALRMKSETVDEITGAAIVMRELATKVEVDVSYLVDTCGTGGDGACLFNVSTAAAFVVAAAGGRVAKHGNRSVTSSTGSADLLEAAGINLDLSPEQVAACIREVGIGFMYAVAHHGAMKHAIGPRRELGLRTVFNILGPITNPANVKRQVLGVFNPALCKPLAEVLQRLGSEHVMVVCAAEGLDEFSVAGPTHVAELKNGNIEQYTVSPEQFGIEIQTLHGLVVDGAQQSLDLISDALGAQRGAHAHKAADMIAMNAGAAIYVSGLAASFEEGVARAQDAIGSGLARGKLSELQEFTACFKE